MCYVITLREPPSCNAAQINVNDISASPASLCLSNLRSFWTPRQTFRWIFM